MAGENPWPRENPWPGDLLRLSQHSRGIEEIGIDALRTKLRARQERHRALYAQYEAQYKILENSDILVDTGHRLAHEGALI